MRIRAPRLLRATRARDESGQVLVLLVVAIVALLGIAAFVVDLGHAYYVQRSLQASADAAATAGALELPNSTAAVGVARDYSGSAGGRNERENVPNVQTTVSTRCLSIAPCAPVNAIVVRESATVQTFFARIFGVDTVTVSARATACSPCSATPLDIMLVLDRTLSMCQDSNGRLDPRDDPLDPRLCTDLDNARSGMRTFLQHLDASIQHVGLAVLPPALRAGESCVRPLGEPHMRDPYNSSTSQYVVVPLSRDYKIGDRLNESSNLVSTIGCVRGGGITAYATAIDQAQVELDAHGRPDVQNVIVFLSDGAANYDPSGSAQPCHQGVSSAAAAKERGTQVYTIGYDLNANGGGANICREGPERGRLPEAPAITAHDALRQMATDEASFYNQPTAGELDTIFSRIAFDASGTRLVDDSIE
jgi:putative Flp pilus-assembly TadE/G-like protein/von Willebrand factor type A domain-containing protein